MTPKKFRQLALNLSETSEIGDKDHPEFRVQGKVFVTLFPGDGWSVVKMTRALQAELVNEHPAVFEACKGAWGRNGATIVFLRNAEEGSVLRALIDAWRKNAPESLREDFTD